MQTKHKILIVLAVVSALVAGVVAGVHMPGRDRAGSVRVYALVFEVVDADTGQKLNVSISSPKQTAGEPFFPWLLEAPLNGPYRITCVDTALPEFRIECEGYEGRSLKLQDFRHGNFHTAPLTTHTIRLQRKAEHSRSTDAAVEGKGDVDANEQTGVE